MELQSKRRISKTPEEARVRSDIFLYLAFLNAPIAVFLVISEQAADVIIMVLLTAIGLLALSKMMSRKYKEAFLDDKYLYYIDGERVVKIDRKYIKDVKLFRSRPASMTIHFSRGALSESIEILLPDMGSKTPMEKVTAWEALRDDLLD